MRVASVLLLLAFLVTAAFAVDNTTLKDSRYDEYKQAINAYKLGNQLTERQHEILTFAGVIVEGHNELDRTGGPDNFGYYYFDSDEANGPAYDWLDITETGEALAIPFDDDYTGPFALGFDFEFYGNTYDQFFLGSNGMIGFSEDAMWDLGNQTLPSNWAPNNLIAWWWRDMDPDAGDDGMAYIENMGDFTVIQFVDWDEYPDGPDQENINAEILLYESGDIVIQYHSMTPNLNRDFVTIGIENAEGTDGLEYCYNNAGNTPQAETAVGFTINEGGFADPNASVEGVVTDACDGDAVEGAEVYFGNQMATTDADGYYMIEGVYSRGYTARAMAEGFALTEVDVVLEEGENVVDIEMDPLAELMVDPDQFTFDVGWLASDSDILTVTHLGDCGADIDFWVDITYIEDEEIMDFRRMVRENAANFRATRGTTIEYNGPSSDIFNVVPTEPQFSELDDPYFLLFQDQIPWNNSHQDYLNELGIPFDLVNSASMADYDFEAEEYNVIMIPSTQGQGFYNNFMNNADRFEEWVDGGGCLEFHGCTQGATWTFWNDMNYVHQGDGNNQVVMPDHPMMEGIPENYTGGSANHGWIDNVPEDALILCVDTQQRPVLLELPYGGGNMIVSTQTLEYGVGAGQVAGDIMHNMIEYDALWVGSGNWLTVEPDAGTVEPAGIMDLDVTVDASNVDLPGIYEASIDVWYNDGTEEGALVTSWVTMNVGDPGSLEGIVYDVDSGDPIEGALVTIWGDLEEPVAEVETDAEGFYTYPLGTGEWDVMADAMGYYPSDIETAAVIEGEATVHDIALVHEVAPELVVDPEFFDFEAGWLGSDSDILTLSNIGGLPADWSGSITYIEDEIAARGNNEQARREAVVENWIARSGILDGPITNYPLATTLGANGPDVVTRPDQIARVIDGNGELDNANILLYPADDVIYQDDVANKLAALELFETITIVDARNVLPSLEELMEFDAVMTWTNYGYLDYIGVGNVMADYVDEGYGVVHAVFESAGVYMQGRWNAEGYYAFPPSGNQYGPQQTLGEVFEANHLMMEEIEELDGGTSSYRQSTFDVHPEALRIADWGDGRAVAAVRDQMDNGITVALGLFPPSNDAINGGWNPATDCDRLMANALLVASGAGGWLAIEPNSGHLDIDETVEIDVLANAIDAELPGVYEATIDFNVAWPDTLDPVTVWVTFLIGDPGTLEGVVSDNETGDPVEGALVTIWGDLEEPVAEVETDENGYYAYPLGTGDWDVQATAADYYASDIMTVALIEGETTTLDIEIDHHIPPFVTLNPNEFIFVIPEEGDTDSDVLTIGNAGGLDMDWDASVVYIEEEEVNTMRENARDYILNRTLAKGAVDFNHAPSTDINAYPSIPTAPYTNELDDPYFLIIQDTDAWGAPAHQAFLDAMEVPYDIINSGQMANHDLGEYSCIIFTNVQSQNFLNTVQDNEERFLDFMDDGGWIIFGGCTQAYTWNLWGMSNTYAPSGTGFNNMPEHGIMMNIPEQWTGGSDSHDIINDVPEDANILATTSLGQPTLVEMEMGRGTILISTMTWEIGWILDWVNADILGNTIAYATLYAGQGGWLTVEPGDGLIPIGEEMDVDLIADVTDLEMAEGSYEALIEIDPNHHQGEIATVWVTLIYGAGGIFNPVDPNGLPYSLILDGAFEGDNPLPAGSGVAVYDGDLCVGATAMNGQYPRSLIAWEMSEDPAFPGFTPGNTMTFQIWNSVTGEIMDAEAEYTQGDGTFGYAPYSRLTVRGEGEIQPDNELEIPLQGNYFELISSYIQPESLNAMDIFGGIPDLAIAYQNDGGIVIPPFINTIVDISMDQGYRLFCDANSMVTFVGDPIPTDTEYHAVPNRWNWVGYPFNHDVNTIEALNHIRDFVEIVQTDDGGVWIPPLFDINTIGDMTPGEGYMFFVNEAVDFTYNDAVAAGNTKHDVWDIPAVEGAPEATGLPYTVVLSMSDDLQELNPAIIELYDGKTLVGKSVILDDRDYTPVTAWQGDADRNLEGFISGNSMRFVVKAADGTVLPVVHMNDDAPEFGKGAYTLLNLDVAPVPTEFAVDQGYPNPFNPSVTIPFALPMNGEVSFAVYNVLGQQVFNTSQHFQAGFHRFVFDANRSGTELVSGVYFLTTQFNGQTFTQKITLLK
ncbi:carboxypeptidase regulatory-like domain-containing protein [bacterium]|nr:carboxypeptidase regulatory-like domain-containing protein [bacterium]